MFVKHHDQDEGGVGMCGRQAAGQEVVTAISEAGRLPSADLESERERCNGKLFILWSAGNP
ncbi:MAG: hypothetical protein ACJ797_00585 [Ktedonobacteraceae bacterium]